MLYTFWEKVQEEAVFFGILCNDIRMNNYVCIYIVYRQPVFSFEVLCVSRIANKQAYFSILSIFAGL
jgi:hypothetical protein